MKKIKLSWSILSAWASGDQDRALKMLMGEETPTNWHMEEGKRIHQVISDHKMMLLPIMKPTCIFEDIVPDKKKWVNYFRVPVFEWLDLSMVVDVYDPVEHLLIDWKTGSTPSSQQKKMQPYIYAYGLAKEDIQIDTAIIANVQELPDKTIVCRDYTMIQITPDKLELAENYIETIGSEIYNLLQERRK